MRFLSHNESVGAYVVSSQAVSGGGEVSESSVTPAPNSSPPGRSHSRPVLNFHFTPGNQLLVSGGIEKKRATYPENKLNLSTPPN